MTPTSEYRTIPLTRGQVALVDTEDYERLVTMGSWHATWNSHTKSFYACKRGPRSEGMPHIAMHRVVLGLERGDQRQGDHQNRDTLDNRRANLRISTVGQNRYNAKLYASNSSGFKGVSYLRKTGKWMAGICSDGKAIYLGVYATAQEANAAVCRARADLHREFARVR